jgi:predicted RNA binding protein YcfA (HicA-like mRNA interferase family)
MSKLSPVARNKLIKRLHSLGFEGPFSGGKHMFMSRKDLDVRIPNPHEGDISSDLLIRILKQAGVSRREWMESA